MHTSILMHTDCARISLIAGYRSVLLLEFVHTCQNTTLNLCMASENVYLKRGGKEGKRGRAGQGREGGREGRDGGREGAMKGEKRGRGGRAQEREMRKLCHSLHIWQLTK